MITFKIFVLQFIVLLVYSLTLTGSDGQQIKFKPSKPRYLYNHPPGAENYANIPVSVVYDKVIEKSDRQQKTLEPTVFYNEKSESVETENAADAKIEENVKEEEIIKDEGTIKDEEVAKDEEAVIDKEIGIDEEVVKDEGLTSTEETEDTTTETIDSVIIDPVTEIITEPEVKQINLEQNIPVAVVYDEEPRVFKSTVDAVRPRVRKLYKRPRKTILKSAAVVSETDISESVNKENIDDTKIERNIEPTPTEKIKDSEVTVTNNIKKPKGIKLPRKIPVAVQEEPRVFKSTVETLRPRLRKLFKKPLKITSKSASTISENETSKEFSSDIQVEETERDAEPTSIENTKDVEATVTAITEKPKLKLIKFQRKIPEVLDNEPRVFESAVDTVRPRRRKLFKRPLKIISKSTSTPTENDTTKLATNEYASDTNMEEIEKKEEPTVTEKIEDVEATITDITEKPAPKRIKLLRKIPLANINNKETRIFESTTEAVRPRKRKLVYRRPLKIISESASTITDENESSEVVTKEYAGDIKVDEIERNEYPTTTEKIEDTTVTVIAEKPKPKQIKVDRKLPVELTYNKEPRVLESTVESVTTRKRVQNRRPLKTISRPAIVADNVKEPETKQNQFERKIPVAVVYDKKSIVSTSTENTLRQNVRRQNRRPLKTISEAVKEPDVTSRNKPAKVNVNSTPVNDKSDAPTTAKPQYSRRRTVTTLKPQPTQTRLEANTKPPTVRSKSQTRSKSRLVPTKLEDNTKPQQVPATTVRQVAKTEAVTKQPTIRQKVESKANAQVVQTKTEVSRRTSTERTTSTTKYNKIRGREREPVVPIIESENHVYAQTGTFIYSYEGGDGTKAYSTGVLKSFDEDRKGEAVEGGFSYKDKDGTDISLSYTADENGYRPVGAHLPTPPPIPPAIARALAYLATKTTPAPVTKSLLPK